MAFEGNLKPWPHRLVGHWTLPGRCSWGWSWCQERGCTLMVGGGALAGHRASASRLWNGTSGTLSPGDGFGVSPLPALRYPDPAGINIWVRSWLYPSPRGCVAPSSCPRISSLLRGSSISERGHCGKAMTAQTIQMRRLEWVCVFVAHPGSLVPFAAGCSRTTSFAPGCPCHLHTARAGSGPHTGWLVPLSTCAVSPQHCVLARGCLLSTLHSPLEENPSCLSMFTELSPGPARPPDSPSPPPTGNANCTETCKMQQETLSILQLWCWTLIPNHQSSCWLQEDLPWRAVVANGRETELC